MEENICILGNDKPLKNVPELLRDYFTEAITIVRKSKNPVTVGQFVSDFCKYFHLVDKSFLDNIYLETNIELMFREIDFGETKYAICINNDLELKNLLYLLKLIIEDFRNYMIDRNIEDLKLFLLKLNNSGLQISLKFSSYLNELFSRNDLKLLLYGFIANLLLKNNRKKFEILDVFRNIFIFKNFRLIRPSNTIIEVHNEIKDNLLIDFIQHINRLKDELELDLDLNLDIITLFNRLTNNEIIPIDNHKLINNYANFNEKVLKLIKGLPLLENK